MERTVRLEDLDPGPRADYRLTMDVRSFSVELAAASIVATPRAGVVISADEAADILEGELRPILAALSAESSHVVSMQVRSVRFINEATPELGEQQRRSGGFAMAAVIAGQPRHDLLLLRVGWAATDPVYCEMLDLFAEAKASPNPRPAAVKLWERLEARYGNERETKEALNVSSSELRVIKGDQDRFVGDRHATLPLGVTPTRIDDASRRAALAVAAKLIATYELREFGANGMGL
jgi:hypothetical protein